MTSLLYLIPASLILAIIALCAFIWTVRARQYDDPEGDRYRIFGDDDRPLR